VLEDDVPLTTTAMTVEAAVVVVFATGVNVVLPMTRKVVVEDVSWSLVFPPLLPPAETMVEAGAEAGAEAGVETGADAGVEAGLVLGTAWNVVPLITVWAAVVEDGIIMEPMTLPRFTDVVVWEVGLASVELWTLLSALAVVVEGAFVVWETAAAAVELWAWLSAFFVVVEVASVLAKVGSTTVVLLALSVVVAATLAAAFAVVVDPSSSWLVEVTVKKLAVFKALTGAAGNETSQVSGATSVGLIDLFGGIFWTSCTVVQERPLSPGVNASDRSWAFVLYELNETKAESVAVAHIDTPLESVVDNFPFQ
jgi:hypothetical protein